MYHDLGWSVSEYVINFFSMYFNLIIFSLMDEPIFAVPLLAIVIGKMKIFQKAGIKKWKAIIPVYSDYILCKIAIGKAWPFIIWMIGILYCAAILYLDIVTLFSYEMDDFLTIARPFCKVALLAVVIVRIYMMYKLSRSFGYSVLITIVFTIGLVILEPIFLCILGFNKSEYIGSNYIAYHSYDSQIFSGNQIEEQHDNKYYDDFYNKWGS